jgi:uncharacterized membrane protein
MWTCLLVLFGLIKTMLRLFLCINCYLRGHFFGENFFQTRNIDTLITGARCPGAGFHQIWAFFLKTYILLTYFCHKGSILSQSLQIFEAKIFTNS